MCLESHLLYEVAPGGNLPTGLSRLRLPVLSPIWRGRMLAIEYPDGEVRTLVGWSGPGQGGPCGVLVFWTRHEPGAPAVCLALGGRSGLRELPGPGSGAFPRGLPFQALAEGLIPPEVREVIGASPPAAPREVLLLA